MNTKKIFFILFLSTFTIQAEAKLKATILPGAFQTELYYKLIKDKVIGIVANQTSILGKVHLVDSLKSAGFKIKCVFAPEHGFRGEKGAGEAIENHVDSATGIPVISLYGKHQAPDSSDLAGIDILLFDIQDVGVRFYTYISTLQLVMEACSEYRVPIIILDRPNPNGFYVDGPVLEKKYSSFVGMQPIPLVHGMTIGEYAKMLVGEKWLRTKKKCYMYVVPVKNYYHATRYQLPIPPSPNLPDMDAVYLYPSVCLFEGTAVSLGRGTDKPFRYIGFPGNKKDTFEFKPISIPGFAPNPPYKDTVCTGVDLSGQGYKIVEKPALRLNWLKNMYQAYPDKKKFFNSFFEKLSGSSQLRRQIIENRTDKEIRESWKNEIKKFKLIRKKYLIYVDFE